MKVSSMDERNQKTWPDIPYGPWRSTCSALHLYSQIIGKYRLARTPWVNHSWHDATGSHGLQQPKEV